MATTQQDDRARLVEDRAKVEVLHTPVLEAWFPDGPENPGLVLVEVESADETVQP